MDTTPQSPLRSRREFLTSLAALGAALPVLTVASSVMAQSAKVAGTPAQSAKAITVYKDPNCGCCAEWVKHLKQSGFEPTVRDMTDMATVKRSFGVPVALESCHTARIGRYTIEGHVPADVIAKLVKEQPANARGLAVPGMPVGSPGMEMGGRKDPYDVILFDTTGKTRVYASR